MAKYGQKCQIDVHMAMTGQRPLLKFMRRNREWSGWARVVAGVIYDIQTRLVWLVRAHKAGTLLAPALLWICALTLIFKAERFSNLSESRT
jgi:hypothetical protein